ncbi:hypothetical protein LguiA_033844 [Lonicera macranthoides]
MGNQKETSNSGGQQDLHTAARSGDLNAVQLICSSNPLAVNSRDKHSRTPLHLAAWSGQAQVVSYLCKNKADVGAAAMDDMGAIHFAAQKGHLEVVRTLISSGVSVKSSNRKGMTPLHYAVQGSYLDLIKYLVKKGANLTAKTKAGKTPLDLAKSDEVRSVLAECEKELSKGDASSKEKGEDGEPKLLNDEKGEGFEDEANTARVEEGEHEEESAKRKGNEGYVKENLPEPKRAKVALSHLLASDDGQEEEENV